MSKNRKKKLKKKIKKQLEKNQSETLISEVQAAAGEEKENSTAERINGNTENITTEEKNEDCKKMEEGTEHESRVDDETVNVNEAAKVAQVTNELQSAVNNDVDIHMQNSEQNCQQTNHVTDNREKEDEKMDNENQSPRQSRATVCDNAGVTVDKRFHSELSSRNFPLNSLPGCSYIVR